MSLEDRLGHRFEDPALYRLALTHRSISSDSPDRDDNERLEFLGDAVLQLVVTDLLYSSYTQLAEGEMAKVRAAVVSKPTLAEIARSLELGIYIDIAPSEEATGGREKDSILADAVEAIIGAVYLDAGLEEAGNLIRRFWESRVAERAKQPGVMDYKTRLQEILASEGRKPVYKVKGSGPDHDRRFTAVVTISGAEYGEGEGKSKKAAEQAAAEKALTGLRRDR
jgi:ribonuclease-3